MHSKLIKIIMKRILFPIVIAALSACCNTATEPKSCENPVIENIMARRSIRHYTDQAVPREILRQLAECGVNAPNAMNRQNWEVRIINNPEYFEGLTKAVAGAMPFKDDDPKFKNIFRNATAAIAVACPDDESGMSLINVGLLAENVCLAAKSLGLGSVIMAGPVMMMNTAPEAKPYLDRLNLSEGFRLRIVIGLGYPDEEPEARPRDLNKIQFVD